MAQDINLLPDQSGEDKQQSRQKQTITRVSVAVLVITILVVAGLFAANLFFQTSINALDNNIVTQTQRIQAKKDAEGVYRALDAKLTGLSNFVATQKHYSTFLDKFGQTIPSSLTLTDMTVDATNIATVSGKVATYSDLAGFYDKLRTIGAENDTDVSPYFTDPALVTISRDDQSAMIVFSMSFTLSPQALTVQSAEETGDAS